MLSLLKRRISRVLETSTLPIQSLIEKSIILQSQALALHNRGRYLHAGLHEAEFRGFSQWGEDGIISWLIDCLPNIPRTFVEFGVEDYRESNTRLLVQVRNWRGLIMDGSAENIASIHKQEIYWRYEIFAKCAFIDRENVNDLISSAGYSGDIGILSVDIDGNDYWVWAAIEVVNPVIVVCEYNAVFGDFQLLTVPYSADFQRTKAHHSNLYFGASIRALINLGNRKGYTFVGTTSTGCNAFFVRNDYAAGVLSAMGGALAYPSSVREGRDIDGALMFTNGVDRFKVIEQLPLIDLGNGQVTNLASCGGIYSDAWIHKSGVQM